MESLIGISSYKKIDTDAIIQAEKSAGRQLSRRETGAITGIVLLAIGLTTARLFRMDRAVAVVVLTEGVIAVIGGAAYLGIEKGVSIFTQRRYERLVEDSAKIIDAWCDPKDLPTIAVELVDKADHAVERFSEESDLFKINALRTKCLKALKEERVESAQKIVKQLETLLTENNNVSAQKVVAEMGKF